MPLTSITKCYKTFPSYFAEKVTQHVRKRRECYNSTPNEQDDKEVRDACINKGSTMTSRDRPPSRAGERMLMTKRSLTPLATVSDNESEDGSTPRDIQPNDTPRSNSSGGTKRESPRPMTAGYFASTINYLMRPRRPQTSPRVAVSLDNVDLWEEEDEEGSESEDRVTAPKQGFDRINGVPINPRMTIDLSDLRRSRSPVATKRNKLDDKLKDTSNNNNHKTLSNMQSDLAEAKSRLLESRTKPRVRAHRKMPPATLFPNPAVKGGKPTSHKSRTESSEIKQLRSPVEKTTQPSFQVPRLSSTYSFGDSSSGSVKPFSPVQVPTPPSVPASTAKINELNRVNTKLAVLRSAKTRERQIASRNLHDSGNITLPASITPASTHHPVREDLRKVREIDARGSSDSNMSTGSTESSPERKVKFNNYVTVRDGEMNTLDHLRESNNSAQMFKQKYLGSNNNNNNHSRKSAQIESDKVQNPLRIEMVC